MAGVIQPTEYEGPVKVTVSRADTGETLREVTLSNDFVLICNGERYLKSSQMWGSTWQLNVAVQR